ncbi:GCG_CRPN prefix-to-repeats domain-containing protein [Methylobacterium oryzihabitans]|nr:hypothetical protein [Methylobacterium oryzihabitans]
MKTFVSLLAAGAALAVLPLASAQAMPINTGATVAAPITLVSDGCGPAGWRGPWGHCRDTPYTGPLPGGGFAVQGNGCPAGFWRGPWGHCRDTVFHGRLPGGGFQ